MKGTGFSLHVSHISEMLLKHLSIFASQPKKLLSTSQAQPQLFLPSWVLGEAQSGFQADRHQNYISFSKMFWESVLQPTQRVPEIHVTKFLSLLVAVLLCVSVLA